MTEKKTYSTKDLVGVRVESARKPGTRIGRVHSFIVHPQQNRVVGFSVKRPDVALMFHRSELLVALDGFEISDGAILIRDDKQASGSAAAKRLGFSWDDCVIWQGLPLMTEDQQRLGFVGDVVFDAETGEIFSLKIDQGKSADLLLGEAEIPADLVEGFRFGIGDNLSKVSDDDSLLGALIVKPEALSITREGGLAEKAGAGYAKAASKVSSAVEKAKPKASAAAKKAGEVVNEGAYQLGVQLSKTRGMFANFKKEYLKALNDDSSEKKSN